MRCEEIAEPFTTLYMGGGTPSLLNANQMRCLLDGVRNMLHCSQVEELSVEVNPDDITVDYVKMLIDCGVNRVSMGIQSFNDADLRLVGRRHTARQAVEAVRCMRSAGISNISIDLIYGIPGQTIDRWRANIEQAIALNPEHISAYALSYEEGTRLWQWRAQGKVTEVAEQLSVEMYNLLIDALQEAGYEHYEISNFAKPGFRSRHNSSYWAFAPYLGLGAAAHSYDGGGIRRFNCSNISRYMELVEQGNIAFDEEQLATYECYDEVVMLRLRTAEGIDLENLKSRFGTDAYDYLLRQAQSYIDSDLLRLNENRLVLTRKGIMTSNAIITDLMWQQ